MGVDDSESVVKYIREGPIQIPMPHTPFDDAGLIRPQRTSVITDVSTKQMPELIFSGISCHRNAIFFKTK